VRLRSPHALEGGNDRIKNRIFLTFIQLKFMKTTIPKDFNSLNQIHVSKMAFLEDLYSLRQLKAVPPPIQLIISNE